MGKLAIVAIIGASLREADCGYHKGQTRCLCQRLAAWGQSTSRRLGTTSTAGDTDSAVDLSDPDATRPGGEMEDMEEGGAGFRRRLSSKTYSRRRLPIRASDFSDQDQDQDGDGELHSERTAGPGVDFEDQEHGGDCF